jgi:2-C-methyl-D-erythritol 2,4-cyclodiphosphate synthase
MEIRTGQGIDFHRLVEGRDLWLGGVKIPFVKGALAHSDGDVLLHAICDAILGAAGLRDIGYHFPDTDPAFRNIESRILLEQCITLVAEKGFRVVNIDSTVCLEKPRLAPMIPEMCRNIAAIAGIPGDAVSVKATTTEGMGVTGRGEGIVALASVLLQR